MMSFRISFLGPLLILFVFQLPLTPVVQLHADSASDIDHIVLLIVDGVNPNRLREVYTPNIDELVHEGSYTWNAWTTSPYVTLAAVPAIHTGAPPEVHGVTAWDGEIHAETLTEVFVESGLNTSIVGEDAMLGGYSSTWVVHFNSTWGSGMTQDEYAGVVAEEFQEKRPFFLGLYDPTPDQMGHAHGDESTEYREALEGADRIVGHIVQVLRSANAYENTLIVITTDHGFKGVSHEVGSWSIWRGPGVKSGYEMTDSVYLPEVDRLVSHHVVDIAPTITALAGTRQPSDATGVIIGQILEDPSTVLSLLQEEILGLRERVSSLEGDLSRARSRLSQVEDMASDVEAELMSLRTELATMESQRNLLLVGVAVLGVLIAVVTLKLSRSSLR